jgi:hypothetical protein
MCAGCAHHDPVGHAAIFEAVSDGRSPTTQTGTGDRSGRNGVEEMEVSPSTVASLRSGETWSVNPNEESRFRSTWFPPFVTGNRSRCCGHQHQRDAGRR